MTTSGSGIRKCVQSEALGMLQCGVYTYIPISLSLSIYINLLFPLTLVTDNPSWMPWKTASKIPTIYIYIKCIFSWQTETFMVTESLLSKIYNKYIQITMYPYIYTNRSIHMVGLLVLSEAFFITEYRLWQSQTYRIQTLTESDLQPHSHWYSDSNVK